MIIKSLSRKAGAPGGRAGGKAASPFSKLIRYMNRGFEEEEGRAVLWHNFYGGERTPEEEIREVFERNAEHLPYRKNGNVLYHEILSFSKGHLVHGDALYRMVADIGQEYLRERAQDQLGYGVVHLDTDHIHLHLLISANEVGRGDRVRLSKADFAEVQRRVERFTLERYPDLAQTQIYGRERPRERLKTDVHEQAMKLRTGKASQKEMLKAKLHQVFERAASVEELAKLLATEGLSFYARGKSIGVVEHGADGTERRHRLSTLGVMAHYEATNARLLNPQAKRKEQDMPKQPPGLAGRDAFERLPTAAEVAMEELLTGKLHEHWHGPAEPPPAEPTKQRYRDDILDRAAERDQADRQKPGKDREDDRER